MDELSGCGTGIKWSFENALYQKGEKVLHNKDLGTVEECYHFENPNVRNYIVRLDNGNLIDVKESELNKYE